VKHLYPQCSKHTSLKVGPWDRLTSTLVQTHAKCGSGNKLNSSQLGDHTLDDVPRHISQYHSSCGLRSLDLCIGKLARLGHCIIENTVQTQRMLRL
jgi:hypothetical protein